MLRLNKKWNREWEREKEHENIRCTCVTETDRPFSCGKIALIHFPHSKSSCLQYSCHLAQWKEDNPCYWCSTKNRCSPLLFWGEKINKEKAEEKLHSQTDPDKNNRKLKSGGANKTVRTEKRERERESCKDRGKKALKIVLLTKS